MLDSGLDHTSKFGKVTDSDLRQAASLSPAVRPLNWGYSYVHTHQHGACSESHWKSLQYVMVYDVDHPHIWAVSNTFLDLPAIHLKDLVAELDCNNSTSQSKMTSLCRWFQSS